MADDLLSEIYRKNQAALTRLQMKGEKELVRAYADAMDQIRKDLRTLYERYKEDGKLSNADKTVYNRLKQIESRIRSLLNQKGIEVDGLLKTLTAEQYEEAFFRMAYAFDQASGISFSWGLIPNEAVEEIVTSPLDKLFQSKAVQSAREGAADRIRRDLERAIIRGDSFQTLARRIGKALGVDRTASGYAYGRRGLLAKAMTIARTEGMRALNAGHQRAYQEAREMGCDIVEMWDATLDSRTRPSHGALDGKYRDEEHGGWYVPELGRYVEGPGKSGVASFDINCRCRTIAHVRGFPPAGRYIRGKGTDEPYQTYTEWMTDKAKQGVGDDPTAEAAIRDFQKYMIQYHQDSFVEIDIAGKLEGYVLDPNRPKVRTIQSAFGLKQGDGEYLEKQIRENLRVARIINNDTDKFGRRYRAYIPITGKNGHREEIEVGFIVDFPNNGFDGNSARLATAYLPGRNRK